MSGVFGGQSAAAAPASGASGLFQLLRDGRPRTRAELAAQTGLARSTIASRIDGLLALGLIAPVGDAISTGGRPSSRFAFNPTARVVLAADLGATHATIGISDLSGTIQARHSDPIDITDGPDRVLGWLADSGRELLHSAGHDLGDLAAIGIGLPGPVEHVSGRPTNPPIMPGWDGVDVPGRLRDRIDVPVLVDNDVNLMALGEVAYAWPGVQHFLFVKVATGIGSGVISSGVLQRGAQGIAGDIGHVQVPHGADTPCRCGNRGCLEAVASGPAIAETLRRAGLDSPNGADVIARVRAGDVQAIQAVRQAGRDIGEVLAACVSLINPSVIAIGGSMAQAGEHLIAGAREVVYARSMPLATEHLSIVQSRAAADAGLIGAGVLAIEHVLSPERIDALAVSEAVGF
ncbi:ROK family protein [Herbiconiux sp. UC225_62]|uniref:ROK family transcriptional regulator n=1 Tax=Herbiconiux sp. UC225_62 TaxID=3350168 RepID=UPI0036D246B6